MSLSSDSETYSAYRPGFDYSETFQVRPYAEGDRPKQVHWEAHQQARRADRPRSELFPLSAWPAVLGPHGARGQTPAQMDAGARADLGMLAAAAAGRDLPSGMEPCRRGRLHAL